MSFILDALKKSENERQKQGGPALFEVKVAQPRPGLPLWAVALGALLVINIGVVIWLVLRRPAPPPQPVATAASAPAMVAAAPQGAAAAPMSGAQTSSPVSAPPLPAPGAAPAATVAAAARQSPPPAAAEPDDSLNPDDYEPATTGAAASQNSAAPQSSVGHVTRSSMEGYPTYDQLAGNGTVPELRLDMHVYAAKPQERFAFINMQRVREGDTLPNGVHVDEITQDGVVLSHHGAKFVLERQ